MPNNSDIEKILKDIEGTFCTKKKLDQVKNSIENFVSMDEYTITKV